MHCSTVGPVSQVAVGCTEEAQGTLAGGSADALIVRGSPQKYPKIALLIVQGRHKGCRISYTETGLCDN